MTNNVVWLYNDPERGTLSIYHCGFQSAIEIVWFIEIEA